MTEDNGLMKAPTPVPVPDKISLSREVAEVQGAIFLAKQFPRDEAANLEKILNACRRPKLAEAAVFNYPRGNKDIDGPTIRLAEACAQGWGNVQHGIRELEQRKGVGTEPGESTVEAYAWDMENNVKSSKIFQVPHIRYSKEYGNKKLTDPRDIYEVCANQGARRQRACILAVIPGDIVEAARAECEQTMLTKADVSTEGVKKMLESFKKFEVTKDMIEKRIGVDVYKITPAQKVNLGKLFNGLKDGMYKASDLFEGKSLKDTIKEKTANPKGQDKGSSKAPPGEESPAPSEEGEK